MAWSIFTQGGGPLVAVGWAKQFLQRIGAPVTPGNIEFVYQWEKSEGGGGKYNPLNQGPVQGHPNLTTTGSQFGGGAADFASWEAGLEGANIYLHYSNYSKVLAALKANNPTAARTALWNSPWAAGHYGHGSNWFYGTVPGGTPILPPLGDPGTGGGDTGGGGSTQTVANSNGDPDTCAWNFSLPSASTPKKALGFIPLPSFTVGGQDFCLLNKVQVRQLSGAGIQLVGLVVGLVGVFLVVSISGFRKNPLGSAINSTGNKVANNV